MQEDMETEEPVSNKEVLSKTHVQMDSIAGHAVEHMEGSPRSSESKLVDRPKVSMARGRGQRRVTCPECGMGFKWTLIPPLHVTCKVCSRTWHTPSYVRNRTVGSTEFIYQECSPAPPQPQPAPISSVSLN